MSRARDLADGTFSGEFAADSPTLVVDATNNRVGVGTTSPTQEIHGYSSGGDFSLKLETASATGTAYTYYKNADREWASGIRGTVGDNYQVIDVTADATRFAIDSSGRVTMPSQPYFLAYKTGGIISATGTLVFDTASSNAGNHYNTSNGRFTAPVDGVYILNLQIFWRGSGSDVVARADWKLNGISVQEGKVGLIATTDYLQQQNTFLRDLSSGDYIEVDVVLNPNGFLAGTQAFTFLYGYLAG